VRETIHDLHGRGFANADDWSSLQPGANPGKVVRNEDLIRPGIPSGLSPQTALPVDQIYGVIKSSFLSILTRRRSRRSVEFGIF